jgi:hypothetical protein
MTKSPFRHEAETGLNQKPTNDKGLVKNGWINQYHKQGRGQRTDLGE